MKKINYVIAALSALAIVFSCAKESDNTIVNAPETTGQITISATISDVLTKVGFDPAYTSGKPTGMTLTWTTGDILRVYNHDNKAEYQDFTLLPADNGKKDGHFTGTPISASSYDVEVYHASAPDYANQTQPSDGITTDLKYLASASDIADYNDITFTSFSSVLAITAKMPSTAIAAKIKSVDITASDNIFNGGNTLTITLSSIGDADSDGILHLFATLPQGNQAIAAGTTLLVHFNAPGESHDVYTRYIVLPSTTFTNNKLNTININATASATHAGLTTDDGSTSGKAYLIGDKYQMQAMRGLMTPDATTYFKMVDDIDLNSEDWEPLNYNDSYTRGLNFDGQNHTISNLTAYGSDVAPDGHTGYAYPSFVGVLNGSIKDVTFDHAAITAGNNTAGVLTGYFGTTGKQGNASGVSVINSSVTDGAKVRIGGLAGFVHTAGSTISDCHVSGVTVSSTKDKVGGLIGELAAYTITGCTATDVDVTGAGTLGVGGLVGYLNGGTIDACSSSGTVTGVTASGGLVGLLHAGSITGSNSSVGLTTTTFYTGGLIGQMDAGTVTNSYATGSISNTRDNYAHAGGLVGTMTGGSLEKCHATGNVGSTASTVGGLVGSITEGTISISKCYATGNVTETNGTQEKQNYGGFVGNISGTSTVTITNCYATGAVSAAKYSGGFLGTVTNTPDITVTNGYTTSAVSGAKWNCCVFVGSYTGTLDQYLHCTGFVGWNTSNRVAWTYSNSQAIHDGCYMGKSGSVYSQAVALTGWDFVNVWTTDATPVLR